MLELTWSGSHRPKNGLKFEVRSIFARAGFGVLELCRRDDKQFSLEMPLVFGLASVPVLPWALLPAIDILVYINRAVAETEPSTGADA